MFIAVWQGVYQVDHSAGSLVVTCMALDYGGAKMHFRIIAGMRGSAPVVGGGKHSPYFFGAAIMSKTARSRISHQFSIAISHILKDGGKAALGMFMTRSFPV